MNTARTECVLSANDNNLQKENIMWYFAWVLGVGFAVLLAVMNAMWGENEEARAASYGAQPPDGRDDGSAP